MELLKQRYRDSLVHDRIQRDLHITFLLAESQRCLQQRTANPAPAVLAMHPQPPHLTNAGLMVLHPQHADNFALWGTGNPEMILRLAHVHLVDIIDVPAGIIGRKATTDQPIGVEQPAGGQILGRKTADVVLNLLRHGHRAAIIPQPRPLETTTTLICWQQKPALEHQFSLVPCHIRNEPDRGETRDQARSPVTDKRQRDPRYRHQAQRHRQIEDRLPDQ